MRSLTRKGGKAANPLASNEKCSVYSFQYWFSSTESLEY